MARRGRRRHGQRSAELEAVDHGYLLGAQGGPATVVADPERVVGQLDRPEQARGQDPAVEVVHLRARTGLEQIHSN
jgi:hypothetical protein